jgi:DNA-binding SARP family transcriptional activator
LKPRLWPRGRSEADPLAAWAFLEYNCLRHLGVGSSLGNEALRFRLDLLGTFALRADGATASPIHIATRKGRALLAYLAMQPDARASREQLAALLWGDRDDHHARQALRQCLARLQSDLGTTSAHIVWADHETVALHSHALAVDAIEFERLANETSEATVEQAGALYRGDFLAGLAIEADPFDQWLETERARLAMLAGEVFRLSAEHADRAGRGPQAIAAAERLIAFDPLREDWHRLAISLHARYRGRDAALARASALAGVLRSDLDVAPEPATKALVESIARGSVAPLFDAPRERALTVGPAETPTPSVQPGFRTRPMRGGSFVAAVGAIAVLAVVGLWWSGGENRPWPRASHPSADDARRGLAVRHLIAAMAADKQGELAAARNHYEEALLREPSSITAMIGLARQLMVGGATYRFERKGSLDRAE